jgi:hypothetical protein
VRQARRSDRPLVEYPITKTFTVEGRRSRVEIAVTACPGQWVEYRSTWTQRPPAGIQATCEGQVTLHKKAQRRRGDALRTIRSVADGYFYGGAGGFHGYNRQFMHSFQLNDIDDFEFYGTIRESS